MLTLRINKKSCHALGDTGASVTIISESMLATTESTRVALLINPMILSPFNSDENSSTSQNRTTTVNKLAFLPICLASYHASFPFYVYPGRLSSPILGMDFLECFRTIINCPNQQFEFEFPANHSAEQIEEYLRRRVELLFEQRNERLVIHGDNPINLVKDWQRKQEHIYGILDEHYDCQYNELYTLELSPVGKGLQWNSDYQVCLADDPNGFHSIELLTSQIHTLSSQSTDTLYIDVLVKFSNPLQQERRLLYLTPLQHTQVKSLSDCSDDFNVSSSAVPTVDFQPLQVYLELPLPHQQSKPIILDYSSLEYEQAAQEINLYVIKEGSKRFIKPNPELQIAAGDEGVDDVQLVLMAKTLSIVSSKVWYDANMSGLFPGIPEEDVAIRIPLRNECSIKHKVRRLNDRFYQRAKQQIQKEKDLGLIEDAVSEYGFPITCVEKKNGNLRVCGDYRTLNERAVPDRYPLPLIDQLLAKLRGAKYISLFDLSSGFQQLYIYKPHRERLAFVTPFGQFQPIRLPYGFINGPAAFQRQYDKTLGSMIDWGRAYVDDLALSDENNQRAHDLKIATVLTNIQRRGMVVSKEKTLILRTSLPYLGYEINGQGIKAIIKHNVLEELLKKKHKNLLNLQETAGALNWYRKFLPNHLLIMHPIHATIRAIGLYDLPDDTLDKIVYPVVLKVQEHLNKQMMLHHPDYDAEKHLYLYIGDLALACAFWQKPVTGKKELIEYWSKKWVNKVDDYTEEENYALATREAIKHHAALLQTASQTIIFTSSSSFTMIATYPEMQSARAAHYLVSSIAYKLVFQTQLPEEFVLLNKQKQDEELLTHISRVALVPLARYFKTTAEDLATIPMVWTDGSFRKSAAPGGMSAIGVYWGLDSPFNLSIWAKLTPFTNQRAELKAILCTIRQAKSRHLTRLIVKSDSAYAVGRFKDVFDKRSNLVTGSGRIHKLNAAQSMPPVNQDILEQAKDIMKGLNIFFQHIGRSFNCIADKLSRQPFALLIQKRKVEKNAKSLSLEESSESTPLITEDLSLQSIHHYIIDQRVTQEETDPLKLQATLLELQNHYDLIVNPHYYFHEEIEQPISLYNINHLKINTTSTLPSDHTLSSDSDNEYEPVIILDNDDSDADEPHSCKETPHDKIPKFGSRHLLTILRVMAKYQLQDEEIGSLIRAHEKKDPSRAKPSVAHYDFFIVPATGILWVRQKERDRILVPKFLQPEVLQMHHCSLYYASHGGIAATLHHIERMFTWKSIKEDVTAYCNSCMVCKATKPLNCKTPGLLTPAPLAFRPLQTLAIDCLTSLPRTVGTHNQHVMIAVDSFTRFMFAFALPKVNSKLISRSLTAIFVMFGAPRVLLTDKGPKFRNTVVNELLIEWGTKHIFTMTKNPQANGQAEVCVRKLTQKLLTSIQQADYIKANPVERIKYWDRLVPALIYSMNTTYNERLGCSPYDMMFGRSPPVHHELQIEETKLFHGSTKSYHTALLESFNVLHSIARKKQELFRQYHQKQYDKSRSSLKINAGDLVYVSEGHSILLSKLSPPLQGPFPVVEVYRQQDTNEPTAVKVRIDRREEQEYRMYPQYRIRLFKGSHFITKWASLESEASHETLHWPDWDFVAPRYIDDSNLISRIVSCLDQPIYVNYCNKPRLSEDMHIGNNDPTVARNV